MPTGKKHTGPAATSGSKFGGKTYQGAPKKAHRKGGNSAADTNEKRPRHDKVARDARRTESSSSRGFERSEHRHESSDRPAGRYESSTKSTTASVRHYEKPSGRYPSDRPVRTYDEDRSPRSERPARSYDDRPARSYGDRPQRSYDDRPARSYSDRPARSNDRPQRAYDDRPARSYSDRPARSNDRPQRSYDDRPARSYSDRPTRSNDDRPARSYGDRPQRSNDRPVRSYDDRPARSYSDRPARSNDDRPARSYSDRPQRSYDDRPARSNDRPQRSYDDRPARSYSDRPARSNDDRPARSYSDRPQRSSDRPSRPWEDNSPRIDDADRVPMKSIAPVARETREKVVVTDDNGFSALGLPQPLVEALAAAGIAAPFAIQGEAIPDGLAGVDVLARAQTGSGKTLAFGLPMIAKLAGQKREANKPHGLILVPTRELAMQVLDAIAPLGKSMGLKMVLIAGGMAYNKQLDALKMGVDVLVATPGRLIDLMDRGAANLSAVQIAVLDEADQMCDMGFAPEVSRILDETPADGQRLLFSATLDGDVDKLVKKYLHNPVRHSTADAQVPVTAMEHHVFVVHPGRKSEVTAELASREGRTIVFVRTKLGADRVAEKLRDAGVGAAALHGGLNQSARTRTLAAFKDGHVPVLVATDVAARGIHIDDVQLVLQADPPTDHKTYLHRAGRTARAGGSGSVVTLAMPRERNGVERTTRSAGVDLRSVYVEPGDAPIAGITGGTQPSGIPVAEYRPPAPQRSPYRGRPRSGGSSNNFSRRPRRP